MNRKLGILQRAWRAFAIISVVCVASFFIFAQSRGLPSGAPCMFHSILGVPCLMCGGTRAFFALSQGRLADAWYLNPLVFPVVLAVVCICFVLCVEAVGGRFIISGVAVELARLLSHPMSAPMIILCAFLLWTLRVVDAVASPKPELLREEGIVIKILHKHGASKAGCAPYDD